MVEKIEDGYLLTHTAIDASTSKVQTIWISDL